MDLSYILFPAFSEFTSEKKKLDGNPPFLDAVVCMVFSSIGKSVPIQLVFDCSKYMEYSL